MSLGIYRATQVDTASPTKLAELILLRALADARAASLVLASPAKAHELLMEAQVLMGVLAQALSPAHPAAEPLRRIMRYVHESLVEANLTKSLQPLQSAIEIMGELLNATALRPESERKVL